MMRRPRIRPELDRAAARYFVYRLHDASGAVLYVGRSCDVPARIRAHVSDARHPYEPTLNRKREWVFDVRSVSMFGPFTWDEAVKHERTEIGRLQPRGNRDLTARDHRPLAAIKSAALAQQEAS